MEEIQQLKDNYYKKQKMNALNLCSSNNENNIVAPYARSMANSNACSLKFNNSLLLTPVIEDKKVDIKESDSYNKQFDLYRMNNNDIETKNLNDLNTMYAPINQSMYSVINDGDMTFDNMVPFTRRRDVMINDYNEYATRNVDIFTGVGLKPKKVEIEPFFQPKESKKDPLKLDETSQDIRNRYISSVGIKLQKEKPFESQWVGVGVNIKDPNVMNLGGIHDDTRILPKTSNELRPLNKQQETYTLPTTAPKFGEKIRTIENIGEVRKYRPEQFKEYKDDELWVGRAAVNAQKAPEKFTNMETKRKDSKMLIGPSSTNGYGSYNPNTEGTIRQSNNIQLDSSYLIGPLGSAEKHQQIGKYGYNAIEQNRETTNILYQGVLGSGEMNKNMTYYNDNAKSTIRQDTSDPFNTYYSNNNNKGYYIQNQDEMKATTRQETNEPFNMYYSNNNNQGYYIQNQDEMKATMRQETNEPFNTHYSNNNNQGYYIQNQDEMKATIRQTTNDPLNTHYSNINNKGNYSQILDEIRATIRQTTNEPLNTHYSNINNKGNYSQILDEIRATIRQTTNEPFNQVLGSNVENKGIYTTIQDEIKSTIRQMTNGPFNTNIDKSEGKGTYVKQLDEAKSTIKQDTLIENYNSNIGSSTFNKNTVQQLDEAKGTLRQLIDFNDYKGIIGFETGPRPREDMKNADVPEGREIISKEREPTWRGTFETPDKNLMNVELKDNPTYNNIKIPDMHRMSKQSDINYQIRKNDVQQTPSILDDNYINIIANMMNNNILVNNLVHKSKNNILEDKMQNSYMFVNERS